MIRRRPTERRRVMVIAIVAASIVNIDLAAAGLTLAGTAHDLHASPSGTQWVITAHLVALSLLLMPAGHLCDSRGPAATLRIGSILSFAGATVAGLAQSLPILLGARLVQGAGGALLATASLTLLTLGRQQQEQARAIGVWTAATGAAAALSLVLGGIVIDAVGWRALYAVITAMSVALVVVSRRDRVADHTPLRCGEHPPATLRNRAIVDALLVTATSYGALGAILYFVTIRLQFAYGSSSLETGLALLPATACVTLLSSTAMGVALRHGPRLPLTIGPVLLVAAALLSLRLGPGSDYLSTVVPIAIATGTGAAAIAAPATHCAMVAYPRSRAGTAAATSTVTARLGHLGAVLAISAIATTTNEITESRPAHATALTCAAIAGLAAVTAQRLAHVHVRRPSTTGTVAGVSETPSGCSCEVGDEPRG